MLIVFDKKREFIKKPKKRQINTQSIETNNKKPGTTALF